MTTGPTRDLAPRRAPAERRHEMRPFPVVLDDLTSAHEYAEIMLEFIEGAAFADHRDNENSYRMLIRDAETLRDDLAGMLDTLRAASDDEEQEARAA